MLIITTSYITIIYIFIIIIFSKFKSLLIDEYHRFTYVVPIILVTSYSFIYYTTRDSNFIFSIVFLSILSLLAYFKKGIFNG